MIVERVPLGWSSADGITKRLVLVVMNSRSALVTASPCDVGTHFLLLLARSCAFDSENGSLRAGFRVYRARGSRQCGPGALPGDLLGREPVSRKTDRLHLPRDGVGERHLQDVYCVS